MITTYLVGDTFTSTSGDAFLLYERALLGEKKDKKIEYSAIEVLYLVSVGKMDVFFGTKRLDFDSLMKNVKRKDKKIETKLVVFSDLRKKGYVVKTALKFGAEFRVYEKGVKPGQDHARWVLFTVREHEHLNWHDFAAKNRVAHSTKKNLLIGLVDEEGDVSYYDIGWVKIR